MKHFRQLTLLLITLVFSTLTLAQDLQEIKQVWKQTLDALDHGDKTKAKGLFGDFNQKVRAYVKTNGRTWQIEYLVGSLDCQFPDTKANGADFLRDILQNNRDLNSQGKDEVKRLLQACTAPTPAEVEDTPRELPVDVADASAHFQGPGVHGDMKGGNPYQVESESAHAISPIPAAELLARRVELSQPQKAVDAAIARLPGTVTGSVVGSFAVTTLGSDKARAVAIGKCLESYTRLLEKEFKMEPPSSVLTVYTAQWTDQVYDYARRLHGLQLPHGVIAYSVAEDMSLTGIANPDSCGSMAHELVHLLIKRNFPVSPAWLEEGLASEVAIAVPEAGRFKFSSSWRDRALRDNYSLRPRVNELLETPWAAFNPTTFSEQRHTVAIQAMAAVFIRYLASQNKLDDVYFAVRDQHFSPDLSEYRSYRQIVEEKLGRNIEDVERDFDKWFGQQAGHPQAGNNPPQQGTVPKPARPCVNVSPMAQQSCEPEVKNKAQ